MSVAPRHDARGISSYVAASGVGGIAIMMLVGFVENALAKK